MVEFIKLLGDLGCRLASLIILVILIVFNAVALFSYVLYETSIKIINKLEK